MAQYKCDEGSIHHKFMQSTAKVQVFGGGFGNGKTASACVKALQIANAYPGCSGLIARATYPKLNDTIRAEFLKWCPKHWIKSFPMGQNSSNSCTLTNGSKINFRYIQQQGKAGNESTTSNLLSATYDFIIVDQIEDPEITYKDFLDLLGRLRGNTPRLNGMSFIPESELPATGPRWFLITTNPTHNWVYKQIIKPLHEWKDYCRISKDLICIRDENNEPVLDANGNPEILVELFEGSTYENKENLGADFIQTLEATYQGQMRERFLLGKWGAYEGLVYPQVNRAIHGVPFKKMFSYLQSLKQHYIPTFYEAYDYGMVSPSCLLFSFIDFFGNVHIIDGFYGPEISIAVASKRIQEIRSLYISGSNELRKLTSYADPDIFRRKSGASGSVVGRSIAAMFSEDYDIYFERGNNDIINGITKVSSYLNIQEGRRNPYNDGIKISPSIFICDELEWFWDEIFQYSWAKDAQGNALDKPMDRNDHAMDALKYLLTDTPDIGDLMPDYVSLINKQVWQERDVITQQKSCRHGR